MTNYEYIKLNFDEMDKRGLISTRLHAWIYWYEKLIREGIKEASTKGQTERSLYKIKSYMEKCG